MARRDILIGVTTRSAINPSGVSVSAAACIDDNATRASGPRGQTLATRSVEPARVESALAGDD